MTTSKVSRDMEQWTAITNWLEDRLATPLAPRDWLRPAKSRHQTRRLPEMTLPAVAAISAIAIGAWFFAGTNVTPPIDESDSADPQIASSSMPIQPILRNDHIPEVASYEIHSQLPEKPVSKPDVTEVDEPDLRWRLAGIVQNGDARVLVLRDQHNDDTVILNMDSEIDGWSVADSGSDYAVLRQGSREIHLALNEVNTR